MRLVLGVDPDDARSPIRPTSGASEPIDATPPSQRSGRLLSTRPGCRSPSCGASAAAKPRTQASHTSATSRSQARPSSARAPPSPRSSATQPIASSASSTNASNAGAIQSKGDESVRHRCRAEGSRPLDQEPARDRRGDRGLRSSTRRTSVHRTAAIRSGSSASPRTRRAATSTGQLEPDAAPRRPSRRDHAGSHGSRCAG